MKKQLLLSGLFSIGLLQSYAQSGLCGTEYKEQQLLSSNPRYVAMRAAEQKAWTDHQVIARTGKRIISGKDTSYEIPVVVHIMHSGEPVGSYYNPSDAAIDSMMDYLNKSWTATWPSYPDTSKGGVNLRVSFALAKRTIDCNPTNGILRVNASALTGYTTNGVIYGSALTGPTDSAIKSLSRWSSNDYYNIYVIRMFDGGDGLAGYAYYPGAGAPDGTFITAKYIRPLTAGGKDFWYTLPHELGHAFNLRHTFEGSAGYGSCPSNSDCTSSNDGVCDTEPHDLQNGHCPSGINTCTGRPYEGVQYNFMNYSTCFDRFTKGQRAKVMFNLNYYRLGLANSLGATPPEAAFTKPRSSCVPTTTHNNVHDIGPHKVALADLVYYSNGNFLDGGLPYADQTCISGMAQLRTGRTDTLTVVSGIAKERVKAWIDFNNNGTFDASELVMNQFSAITVIREEHREPVLIPATAVIGKVLRMRVMADDGSLDPGPCDDLAYGQTEDYSVIIRDAAHIADAGALKLSIYPNPASQVLHINSPTPLAIDILGIDGRRIIHQDNTTAINIASLTDGLYFVQVSDREGNVLLRTRFIKQQ
jgi:hypothetical protein